eukprot:SAG11_NODE_4696_length_1802_cov_1.314151_1_plen_237_part_00
MRTKRRLRPLCFIKPLRPMLSTLRAFTVGDLKLATLGRYFGFGEEQHRALADCDLNLRVLTRCATLSFLEAHCSEAVGAPTAAVAAPSSRAQVPTPPIVSQPTATSSAGELGVSGPAGRATAVDGASQCLPEGAQRVLRCRSVGEAKQALSTLGAAALRDALTIEKAGRARPTLLRWLQQLLASTRLQIPVRPAQGSGQESAATSMDIGEVTQEKLQRRLNGPSPPCAARRGVTLI